MVYQKIFLNLAMPKNTALASQSKYKAGLDVASVCFAFR